MIQNNPPNPDEPEARTAENLYVTVDTCAQLDGQPYKVLEALHDLYAITGRRNLRVIDTQQGCHEKAECFTPAMLSALHSKPTPFGSFILEHPEWTEIVETPSCDKFRNAFAKTIFPRIVAPLMQATKEIESSIRKKAFAILQENHETTLFGKKIDSPSDIEIRIQSYERHDAFEGEVLNEAAAQVMQEWKNRLRSTTVLTRAAVRNITRGEMAAMIKAEQEVKGIAWFLMHNFHPDIAKTMSATPFDDALTLKAIKRHSYLFDHISLPSNAWHLPEMIQAIRHTTLWPWAKAPDLSEGLGNILRNKQSDVADYSYLHLLAEELPLRHAPNHTLYVVLTHDGPLQTNFVECTTGLHKIEGKGGAHDRYEPTLLYKNHGITQRAPGEYPAEAALVGSEFVAFMYGEIIDSLKTYVPQEECQLLKDEIEKNGFTKGNNVGALICKSIEGAQDLPEDRRKALEHLLEEVKKLEAQIKYDIEKHGAAGPSAHYSTLKQDYVGSRGK